MLRYYFLSLLMLGTLWSCYGQRPLLKHYTVADGLPSNMVYYIFQDSKGFIWICTDCGVSRFDGRHFDTYTSDDGLPDNEVMAVSEDAWNRCWLSTYNGRPAYIYNSKIYAAHNDDLCRQMEKKEPKFNLFFANETKGLFFAGNQTYIIGKNTLRAQKSDSITGPLWVQSSYKGVVYGYNHDGAYRKQGTAWEKLLSLEKYYLTKGLLLKGHLVISGGCFKPTGIEWTLHDIDLSNEKPVVKRIKTTFRVLQLVKGKNEEIWCCTDYGVYRYDPNKSTIGKEQLVGLEGRVTYYCFIDSRGVLWYATNNGIYMQLPGNPMIYDTSTGLSANNTRSISYTRSGSLLAGYDNNIIDILDSGSIRAVSLISSIRWNRTMYLMPMDQKSAFAGTDDGVYRIDMEKGIASRCYPYGQKSAAVKGDSLFFSVGVLEGVAGIYNNRNGKIQFLRGTQPYRVTATGIDGYGRYWLGTLKGLYTYHSGKIQKFHYDSTLSLSRITSIKTLHHQLVVSTYSNGLFIIDGTTVFRIGQREGLISNVCKKIAIDGRQRIWVITDKGLERITLSAGKQFSIYHLSAADGIPGYMINDLAFGNRKAYLATSQGIVVINEDQSSADPPYRVFILSASANDSMINAPEKIVLNYKQNNVRITFTAIAYTAGNDIHYKYLLRGGSNDTVATQQGSLNLGALKSGNYELLVWASGRNNNWNKEPARLLIVVKPPVWGTPWFILTTVAGVLFLGIMLHRYRANKIKTKEKELAVRKRKMLELEMQALRAQINPHFMFNALNAIQNYYNQNDELNANYYMTSFARLIRQTLTYAKEHWVAIADELSMLKAYIELEQMRFKNTFVYEIAFDPDLAQFEIPTMLLQIYAENAINHGLRHLKQHPGKLTITCSQETDVVICRIEDNGVGFSKAQRSESKPGGHKSMGLEISAGRIAMLNELYGSFVSINIIDKHDLNSNEQGVIVEITINRTIML